MNISQYNSYKILLDIYNIWGFIWNILRFILNTSRATPTLVYVLVFTEKYNHIEIEERLLGTWIS